MNATLCNWLFYTENIGCNSQLFLRLSYLYGCNTTVFNDFYSSYLKILIIFHKCINLQLKRCVYIIIHYVSTLYLYNDILFRQFGFSKVYWGCKHTVGLIFLPQKQHSHLPNYLTSYLRFKGHIDIFHRYRWYW